MSGVLMASTAGAHEAGHLFAAKKHGVELAPPLLVPSNLGFLGSFGAVTRIKSTLKNREQLLEVGSWYPRLHYTTSGRPLPGAAWADSELNEP